jgi:hypothetical protein
MAAAKRAKGGDERAARRRDAGREKWGRERRREHRVEPRRPAPPSKIGWESRESDRAESQPELHESRTPTFV